MLDQLLAIGAVATGLFAIGMIIGLTDKKHFRIGWLAVAVILMLVNDTLVSNFFGAFPVLHDGNWNWQGKALALGGSLLIAATAWFGWRRTGITFNQGAAPRCATWLVIAGAVLAFVVVGLVFPNEPVNANTLAFQATMPGLEEEVFYRGILLLALNEAFTKRWRVAGVSVGWAALLTTILFGCAHAVSYSESGFTFDLFPFLVTALPALVLVWLRERTGSVVWPIVVHNIANTVPLLI